MNLFTSVYACLLESSVEHKVQCSQALYQDFQQGRLDLTPEVCPPVTLTVPGRPEKPHLVTPAKLKRRKLTSDYGRAALVHAITHIEFNAINLALDAVYRFRHMPEDFYRDWLQVAAEEALHFSLLRKRLQTLAYDYGDFPAHNGLWEMAVKTDHDVLVRMALVPRVLEARGLDVTPGMIQRLLEVGDEETVKILNIILRDEIGHVRIGSHWYHYCCQQENREPEATFLALIKQYMKSPVRGPFYTEARLQAGFSLEELRRLEHFETRWLAELKLKPSN